MSGYAASEDPDLYIGQSLRLSVIFEQRRAQLVHLIMVRFLLGQIGVVPPKLTTISKVDHDRNLAQAQCYAAGCGDNTDPCNRCVPLSPGDGTSEIQWVKDLSFYYVQYLQIDDG
jgi:hypothetical protein